MQHAVEEHEDIIQSILSLFLSKHINSELDAGKSVKCEKVGNVSSVVLLLHRNAVKF